MAAKAVAHPAGFPEGARLISKLFVELNLANAWIGKQRAGAKVCLSLAVSIKHSFLLAC